MCQQVLAVYAIADFYLVHLSVSLCSWTYSEPEVQMGTY
jgi:hypothetical protein